MKDSQHQALNSHEITRRRFGKLIAVGALCVGFVPTASILSLRAKHSSSPQAAHALLDHSFESFTPYQATVIQEVSALIIPTDQDPGAREAGVVFELDRIAAKVERYREIYRMGINWLDDKADDLYGKQSFLDVNGDGREKLLELASSHEPSRFEAAKDLMGFGETHVGKHFFELVRMQTLVAFYSSPFGWQTVGYQGPPQWSGNLDYSFCG